MRVGDRATVDVEQAVRDQAARPRGGIATTQDDGRPRPAFLVCLAVLATISPFATDMYLPAFPEITAELGATPSTVQLTLTAFLIGIAVGQLVFGPLSDRFGRKPPLLVGTAICVAASLVAALAPTIEVLVGARFVQGLAGAAGIVISRAIVSDLFVAAEAARTYSLLAVVGGIAPVAAPLVGGFLAGPVGWRGIMGVLLGLCALMLLVALVAIPETSARRLSARATDGTDPGSEHAGRPAPGLAILRRPAFTGHALIKMFSFCVLMGYISASPFLFQSMIGVGALGSGLLFALNSVALIAVNSVNVRLVRRLGPRVLLRSGLRSLTAAVLLLMALVLAGAPAWWLPVPLVLLVGSMGLIFGNTVALALQNAREAAGTGSAFIGFTQFVGGASVAPLVGLGGQSNALPLVLVATTCTAAAWVCYAVGGRGGVAHAHHV